MTAQGVTKLDVIACVCVAGILIALLLPALQAMRGPGRRAECASRINNLAKATIQYEMSHNSLPGYVNDFGAFSGISDPSMPAEALDRIYDPGDKKLGSWIVPLLPSLDAQPTYEIWTRDKYPLLFSRNDRYEFTENAAPCLAILQCPTSPPWYGSTLGRNSYIANCGMVSPDTSEQSVQTSGGTDGVALSPGATAFYDAQKAANGAFNNQYANAANADNFPAGPRITLADFKDGVGNTVLLSESLQAVPWHQLAPDAEQSARLLQAMPGDEVSYPPLSQFTQGMVWHYEDPDGYAGAPRVKNNRRQPINSTVDSLDIFLLKMTPENAANLARPSSGHAGGVYMGFADGASRFVAESIDYRVYQSLLTPRGSQSDVPMPSFVMPQGALSGH